MPENIAQQFALLLAQIKELYERRQYHLLLDNIKILAGIISRHSAVIEPADKQIAGDLLCIILPKLNEQEIEWQWHQTLCDIAKIVDRNIQHPELKNLVSGKFKALHHGEGIILLQGYSRWDSIKSLLEERVGDLQREDLQRELNEAGQNPALINIIVNHYLLKYIFKYASVGLKATTFTAEQKALYFKQICQKIEAYTTALLSLQQQSLELTSYWDVVHRYHYLLKSFASTQDPAHKKICSFKEIVEQLSLSDQRSDDKTLEECSELLERTLELNRNFLSETLSESSLPAAELFDSMHFRYELEVARENFIAQANVDIVAAQKIFSALSQKLLHDLFEASRRFLGPDLCQIAILLLGSSSREDRVLYSDIEMAVLHSELGNNVATQLYFRLFTEIFNILVISLGETPLGEVGRSILTVTDKEGYRIDSSTHFLSKDGLVGTPLAVALKKVINPLRGYQQVVIVDHEVAPEAMKDDTVYIITGEPWQIVCKDKNGDNLLSLSPQNVQEILSQTQLLTGQLGTVHFAPLLEQIEEAIKKHVLLKDLKGITSVEGTTLYSLLKPILVNESGAALYKDYMGHINEILAETVYINHWKRFLTRFNLPKNLPMPESLSYRQLVAMYCLHNVINQSVIPKKSPAEGFIDLKNIYYKPLAYLALNLKLYYKLTSIHPQDIIAEALARKEELQPLDASRYFPWGLLEFCLRQIPTILRTRMHMQVISGSARQIEEVDPATIDLQIFQQLNLIPKFLVAAFQDNYNIEPLLVTMLQKKFIDQLHHLQELLTPIQAPQQLNQETYLTLLTTIETLRQQYQHLLGLNLWNTEEQQAYTILWKNLIHLQHALQFTTSTEATRTYVAIIHEHSQKTLLKIKENLQGIISTETQKTRDANESQIAENLIPRFALHIIAYHNPNVEQIYQALPNDYKRQLWQEIRTLGATLNIDVKKWYDIFSSHPGTDGFRPDVAEQRASFENGLAQLLSQEVSPIQLQGSGFYYQPQGYLIPEVCRHLATINEELIQPRPIETNYAIYLLTVAPDASLPTFATRAADQLPILVQRGTEIYLYGKKEYGATGYTRLNATKFQQLPFPPPGTSEIKLDGKLQPKSLYEEIAAATNQTLITGHNHLIKRIVINGTAYWFKFYPEMPSTELAVSLLYELMLGYGTAHSVFTKITIDGKTHPVLISADVPGKRLDTVLEENPNLRLPAKMFTSLFLMTLFIQPEDGKPNNFILDQQGRLIGIDNDRSFGSPVIKQGGSITTFRLGTKTLVFCLEQMLEELDSEAITEFLTLDVKLILEQLMSRLYAYQEQLQRIFTSQEISTWSQNKTEAGYYPQFSLAFLRLPPQQLLYANISTLQELLRRNLRTTPLELLQLMLPASLYTYYQEKLFQSQRLRSSKDRMDQILRDFYLGTTSSVSAIDFLSASHSCQIATRNVQQLAATPAQRTKDHCRPTE